MLFLFQCCSLSPKMRSDVCRIEEGLLWSSSVVVGGRWVCMGNTT